jgi:hypothetical protein
VPRGDGIPQDFIGGIRDANPSKGGRGRECSGIWRSPESPDQREIRSPRWSKSGRAERETGLRRRREAARGRSRDLRIIGKTLSRSAHSPRASSAVILADPAAAQSARRRRLLRRRPRCGIDRDFPREFRGWNWWRSGLAEGSTVNAATRGSMLGMGGGRQNGRVVEAVADERRESQS